MFLLETDTTTIGVVGAVVAGLLTLTTFAVRWMGGALTRAIRDSSKAQVESNEKVQKAVTAQTEIIRQFIADDKVVHTQLEGKVDRIEGKVDRIGEDVDDLKKAHEGEHKLCRLSPRAAMKVEEAADTTLRGKKPPSS